MAHTEFCFNTISPLDRGGRFRTCSLEALHKENCVELVTVEEIDAACKAFYDYGEYEGSYDYILSLHGPAWRAQLIPALIAAAEARVELKKKWQSK